MRVVWQIRREKEVSIHHFLHPNRKLELVARLIPTSNAYTTKQQNGIIAHFHYAADLILGPNSIPVAQYLLPNVALR